MTFSENLAVKFFPLPVTISSKVPVTPQSARDKSQKKCHAHDAPMRFFSRPGPLYP